MSNVASSAADERLDAARLSAVTVFVLERNSEVATGMRTMLRGVGMAGVKTFASTEELEAALQTTLADVLILSENAATNIFEVTKRVRSSLAGRNPFTVILLLVKPDDKDSAMAALKSGADSALLKPVSSAALVERVAQLAFRRPPFIATTDYVGPERRAAGRLSDIPLIQTINTLRYKLERRAIQPEVLNNAITATSAQLWRVQLQSQGMRLHWSSSKMSERYHSEGSAVLKPALLDLVSVLGEAAVTAARISNQGMVDVCRSLADELSALAEDTTSVDTVKLAAIGKIPAAFERARLALVPQASADAPKEGGAA